MKQKALTVTHVKARLGPLTDAIARTGRPVLMRRGGRIFEIRERPAIEPIEYPPVGDFPVSRHAARLQTLFGADDETGPDEVRRR